MIFNYQFHEAMHEDENTDLFDAVSGDITQFLELPLSQMGRRFTNPSVSRGRSFCGSSNKLKGSMLVMFLRASRWQVGACAFQIQPAKPTLRPNTKLAFLPTFVLKVSPPCATGCFKWLALFAERRLDQPIIPYRGASSDDISDHVGQNSQPPWQSSCNNCYN